MPVIFISQHSASDSNKPERNTCRFNQVTKHVKYLSWNKGVWHLKCEPQNIPVGDVIFSDPYIFTASADTFKRKKRSHLEQASVFKTNHSQWDFWEAKIQHTHTGTHARTHARTHACMHTHIHTKAHRYIHTNMHKYSHIHNQMHNYRCVLHRIQL